MLLGNKSTNDMSSCRFSRQLFVAMHVWTTADVVKTCLLVACDLKAMFWMKVACGECRWKGVCGPDDYWLTALHLLTLV